MLEFAQIAEMSRKVAPCIRLRDLMVAHILLLLRASQTPNNHTERASKPLWDGIPLNSVPEKFVGTVCAMGIGRYLHAAAAFPSLKVGHPAWYFCRAGRPTFEYMLRLLCLVTIILLFY